MVKSVMTQHFTVEAPGDEREVAISDMSLTEEDDVIVCDRDNRRIKVRRERPLLINPNVPFGLQHRVHRFALEIQVLEAGYGTNCTTVLGKSNLLTLRIQRKREACLLGRLRSIGTTGVVREA